MIIGHFNGLVITVPWNVVLFCGKMLERNEKFSLSVLIPSRVRELEHRQALLQVNSSTTEWNSVEFVSSREFTSFNWPVRALINSQSPEKHLSLSLSLSQKLQITFQLFLPTE